jgi:hypothetical protein
MAMEATAPAASGSDADWGALFDATLQHLALLKRKEERLLAEHKPHLNKKRGR